MDTFGPLEIALVLVVVVLLFGVGKVGEIGGALGKSIREFRRERDRKDDDVPRMTTAESKGEKSDTQLEAKSGKNRFCANCGEKMTGNARFCMGCGLKMG